MKKKPFNILAYIPVAVLAITTIGGFVRFQVLAEGTKEKVEKVEKKVETLEKDNKEDLEKTKEENKKDVEELKKENAELDRAVVTQTIRLENIQQILQSIDKKLEKVK